MHLERLLVVNDNNPDGREMEFAAGRRSLRKWIVLNQEEDGADLLRFIVMACATRHESHALGQKLIVGARRPMSPFQLECVLVRHAPQECGISQPPRRICGWTMTPDGNLTPTFQRKPRLDATGSFHAPALGRSHAAWLLLAYGAHPQPHAGTDFYECGPHHRLRRTASFFDAQEKLTDPVAFLERLHFKGITYARPRSRWVLARLSRELAPTVGISQEAWLEPRHDFRCDWERLSDQHRQLVAIALDAARHVFDASAKVDDPFDQTGVVVLDDPGKWCSAKQLPSFLDLLDRLFPRLQFFVLLSKAGRAAFPDILLTKTLPIPQPQPRPPQPQFPRLPSDTVLLVPVDGSLPNVALMKLSRYFKNQCRKVVRMRPGKVMPEADAVWASCIFQTAPSARLVTALRERYAAILQIGGSGIDLRQRLPPEVEMLAADYSLYPELGDRAIGFLTRGCPNRCRFCVVPSKEGPPRRVSDLDSLLQGRKKLILLDDNLLAHPAAEELLEEMARRDLAVNFNQTIDLRRITPETAILLRRIQCANVLFTRRNYYFSLNDTRGLEALQKHYSLLQMGARDNVEFVCMYGFNTTLAEDVARFQFLRSLPGAYVFLQRYQPIGGGPKPNLTHFFDDQAERQIDALLGVNFKQNMKSMEVYYRWVCQLYARHCGRIHQRLVETLFRYNGRHRMGGFVTKMESLCRSGGENPDKPLVECHPYALPHYCAENGLSGGVAALPSNP